MWKQHYEKMTVGGDQPFFRKQAFLHSSSLLHEMNAVMQYAAAQTAPYDFKPKANQGVTVRRADASRRKIRTC
jgi:hypothetical protein